MGSEQPGQRNPAELSDFTPETLFDEDPEALALTYTRTQLLEKAREIRIEADAMQPDIEEAQRLLTALKAQQESLNGSAARHINAAEIAHSHESGE